LNRSTGYGSLSVWTHHLRGVEYIPAFAPKDCPTNGTLTAARVAAGETGGDIQAAMAKHESIVVTGFNPDVGLVGWITGGGHGMLSSTYGMGADNLLEATIVTPSGEVLITNPCQNPDLFFAIRGGGGGTYGVVTEVVVKTYSTPKTTKHSLRVAAVSPNVTTEYWDLVGYVHAEMQRLKDGGMQGYYFIVGPPVYPVHALYWIFGLFDKPNGTIEGLMAPIEERLKTQSHLFQYDSTVEHGDTYIDVFGSTENEDVASAGSAYGSWLLSPQSLADPDVTSKVFSEIGPSNDATKPNVSNSLARSYIEMSKLTCIGSNRQSAYSGPHGRLSQYSPILPRSNLYESRMAQSPQSLHSRGRLARRHRPSGHRLCLPRHHREENTATS
jgi:hypothetical protein